MGFGSFFKKFADIAATIAPIALTAAGLPPALGTAIVSGITAAQGIAGASNETKAAKAAEVAQASLQATNAVLVAQGHQPLVDEAVSADALNQAIKLTYDMTKMVHQANGDPMPAPASNVP